MDRPLRCIFDSSDHAALLRSPVLEDFLRFLGALVSACSDRPLLPSTSPAPPCVLEIEAIMGELITWVNEIPPIAQPMRYGNKAFRTWHNRLVKSVVGISRRILDAGVSASNGTSIALGSEIEIAAYLVDSFGNPTRIDYGTGHETNFFIFLYCLGRLGLFQPEDLPSLALRAFPSYLKVCRKLQRTYWLEPAGSHGVWSLDDYHFLAFLLGSAQLLNHKVIRPKSVLSADILEDYSNDYIYLAAVKTITEVKSGAPFAEHSPILSDLAGLPSWGKVNEQLGRLYRTEVLGKLPVTQHLVFGKLFPYNWAPSRTPCPSDAAARLYDFIDHGITIPDDAISSPEGSNWASEVGATQSTSPSAFTITGVAPWAKKS
jgi:serine/threonine-protein phosphatase 2A activator